MTSDGTVNFEDKRNELFAHIALLGRLHVARACLLDNRPTPRIHARRYAPRLASARVGDNSLGAGGRFPNARRWRGHLYSQ